MTTEVAILNKSAIALAADSAASINTPYGVKVYDTVNKLFELIRGRPVGVMIYNSSELAGIPWETIIKTYREDRRDLSFETLDEYVEDFKQFLSSGGIGFSDDHVLVGFESKLITVRNMIAEKVAGLLKDRNTELDANEIQEVVETVSQK